MKFLSLFRTKKSNKENGILVSNLKELQLRKYLIGFICGMVVGVSGSVFAAKIVGGNGYLMGWDVTVGGEEVCSDPFIWASLREIDCD